VARVCIRVHVRVHDPRLDRFRSLSGCGGVTFPGAAVTSRPE